MNRPPPTPIHIYVLLLQHNKIYVGKTQNPLFRINDHFAQGGAAWTKKYKPVKVLEVYKDCDDSDEQIITQDYMAQYGIDTVRGGPWCKVHLSLAEKQMISSILDSHTDCCYTCGESGHYASQCTSHHKHTTSAKSKTVVCERCGRKSHHKTQCYAKTDVHGNSLQAVTSRNCHSDCDSDGHSDSDGDSEFESEYVVEEGWSCEYCGRLFSSLRGAQYHENVHCRFRYESINGGNDDCDDECDERW